jgi:hypothetical protein
MSLQQSIINIKNNEHKFTYGVRYNDIQTNIENTLFTYRTFEDKISFYNEGYNNIIEDVNDYYEIDEPGNNDYLPNNINLSDILIYIPSYSVDYYNHNYRYIVEISTYINRYKVILGCYLLDKNELLAVNKPVKMLDKVYYVYKAYDIIDPWYINYSQDWEEFRINVCNSVLYGQTELNNDASLLNIEITPVLSSDQHWIKGIYTSGICTFMIPEANNQTNLVTKISMDPVDGLRFDSSLYFNNAYEHSFQGFDEYIRSTYTFTDDYNIHTYVSYILADSEGNFSDPCMIGDSLIDGSLVKVTQGSVDGYDQWVSSWDDWKEGLKLVSMFNVYLVGDGVEADAPLLTFIADDVPITREVFKYMISENNYINIDTMNINTLNTVNKIEKKIINVERPDDYNSPIYMPIYIQSTFSDDIAVHNNVNESIAINLSAYANTVKVFSLMIGDAVFKEVVRKGGNVVFKITGKLLPEEPVEGQYYILNENNELVTSGNYKYI